MGITRLNISFTGVTDLNPLLELPELEKLDLGGLEIFDFSPLVRMPKLQEIVMPDFDEIVPDELDEYLNQMKGDQED